MREILFKAKRKFGEGWISGDLIQNETGKKFIKLSSGIVEVDPDTICQYTGLTDKNGNKIWENDIVIGNFEWYTGKYVIKWLNHESKFGFPCLSTINKSEYEVIGNIFDNLNC